MIVCPVDRASMQDAVLYSTYTIWDYFSCDGGAVGLRKGKISYRVRHDARHIGRRMRHFAACSRVETNPSRFWKLIMLGTEPDTGWTSILLSSFKDHREVEGLISAKFERPTHAKLLITMPFRAFSVPFLLHCK